MVFTDTRAKWPKSIANRGTPRLDHNLKQSPQSEIALTFVNHASFLIQMPGLNVLTDPVWSKRVSPFRFAGPKRVREPGLKLDELPPIDLILVSHNHYDHLDVDTLTWLAKKFSPVVLCAQGDAELIRSLGFREVHEMDWWENFELRSSDVSLRAKITYVPTQHFSARWLHDRCRSLWGGFMLEAQGRKIYFGGDAAYSTHFKEILKRLGAPDLSLLGIGAYKPKWFMNSMHMDPEDAVMADLDLQSRQTVGMHFGTFQLSSEKLDQPIVDLREALKKHHVPEERFITLLDGETRIF